MSENGSNSTSRTDWARVDAMSDDDVDTSDVPPLADTFFERARWRTRNVVPVTIAVDRDVLDWFRARGADGERRMAAALRIYAEARRDEAE